LKVSARHHCDPRTAPCFLKARVPLYLLVDQEFGRWTLEGLAEGWQRYQVAAAGKYGEAVPLPPPFDFEIATTDWPRYRD
jgi:hypothetical protein